MTPQSSNLLAAIVLLPAVGAAALLAIPAGAVRLAKSFALGVSLVVALLAWLLAIGPDSVRIDATTAGLGALASAEWAPSIGCEFLLGVDGLSLPLVLLTASLAPLVLVAAWPDQRRPRLYAMLLLLVEAGTLGVFLALDFVLFYVFWELILIPMYFLIGYWGGHKRAHAALKFFLYTLVGSLLMLAAGLVAYAYSDLTELAPGTLARTGLLGRDAVTIAADPAAASAALDAWLAESSPAAVRFADAQATGKPLRTFNLLALVAMNSETQSLAGARWWGRSLEWWVFVLLLVGLAVKLPAVPLHTWLPEAHVEAPSPVSMLLAGVLLKLGGYGLVRIAWPMCPTASAELAGVVALVGIVGMFWGALAALGQDDFKRLVAYSSVSHMGYVLLGLAVGGVPAFTGEPLVWNADRWLVGASGAVFQMVAHGVTSAGLFFAVGMVYDRVHHRRLDELGGLFGPMPLASGLALVLLMASVGLPGLCGFVGELLVLLPTWSFHPAAALATAAVTVLTAAYTLRAARKAYFGPEYVGPHAEGLTPITPRELCVIVPLVVAAVWLGVRPGVVLDRTEPVLAATAAELARPHTAGVVAQPLLVPAERNALEARPVAQR
ncbi:MAG: complex I subunit 4 family protein [Lacipirellulaceae bacterium]